MKNIWLLIFLTLVTSCVSETDNRITVEGVSTELASYRKARIDSVIYNLMFIIPSNQDEIIQGSVKIDFRLNNSKNGTTIFDFSVPPEYLQSASVNGEIFPALIEKGHIAIPNNLLLNGKNSVEFNFRAGELSLNRNPEFMYSLFVPDRASTAFPCFDQPDIKGKYLLTLQIPGEWLAISNNRVVSENIEDGVKEIVFGDGPEISTYLFAFAAGKFERIVKTINGTEMEMLHREPLAETVERNTEAIFRQHYNSIKWMEEYTGILYPFSKFGFVLIPSFQYGGMEHPGTIYYRASSLFLEESPTVNEQMSRASLIAHETSHIWFGDLVTMKWFDDVWLKEVFAGYMSDKIVNPDFPDVNHDLRFLLSRYPAAYSVDRTRGANPIIQKLDNLKNAGSLYGGIIYNKAPIVMLHLEQMTGDSLLRESLRVYLSKYSYGNAVWDDLIGIIEDVSDLELKGWSNVWVKEPGMPKLSAVTSIEGGKYSVRFISTDTWGKNRKWPQALNTLVVTNDGRFGANLVPDNEESVLTMSSPPLCIVADSSGVGYGYFEIDSASIDYFSQSQGFEGFPLLRGIMWLNLNENLMNGAIEPEKMYGLIIAGLKDETDVLLINYLIGRVGSVYWNFLEESDRRNLAMETERVLWEKVLSENDPGIRRNWFNIFRGIALTEEGIEKLYNAWETGMIIPGAKLSEEEMCTLSLVLALKQHPKGGQIVAQQLEQIKNTDRKKRYEFVLPSVSSDQKVKDDFFLTLADPVNREREPWVLEALGYLHHPLNAKNSVKYIRKSLDMLEEIKYTGDIFFPGSWVSTTLSGHNSVEALEIVNTFLSDNPDYPEDLRLKILQAADHLYRFAR